LMVSVASGAASRMVDLILFNITRTSPENPAMYSSMVTGLEFIGYLFIYKFEK